MSPARHTRPRQRSHQATACLLAFPLLLITALTAAPKPRVVWDERAAVGFGKEGVVLPISQTLTPEGDWVELPGARPLAIALSPDSRWLVSAGKTNLLYVWDLQTLGNAPLPKPAAIPLPNEEARANAPEEKELQPDKKGQIAQTGLSFSPDGQRLYLSNVDGSIKVFAINDKGPQPLASWPLPKQAAPLREAEIPAGLAVSADSKRLFVCGSLSNRVHELDCNNGKVLRSLDVGAIPFACALQHNQLWVVNRAGPRPKTGDITETSGRGMMVKVDPDSALPVNGSLSVIEQSSGKLLHQIPLQKQPGAIAFSPDGRHAVVANVNSDSLSTVDCQTHRVLSTVSTRWRQDDPFGASPTALRFVNDQQILVCLGTQNALASFHFNQGKPRLSGMAPTAWYPSDVVHDPKRGHYWIANAKGLGSGAHSIRDGNGKANTHQYLGAVQRLNAQAPKAWEALTERVLENYRVDVVRSALLPPRPGVAPLPVPERSGEPSVFEHVVYLIRENRTYDQVFGDLPVGNGEKSLCIFGEDITPNAHKIAREFVLLDNTYCSGILSADGHNWALSAFANDFLERSFAGFPRAYPDGLGDKEMDVMSWSPTGFLWSAVHQAGRSIRVCGEMCLSQTRWTDSTRTGRPDFTAFLKQQRQGGKDATFDVQAGHASVRPFLTQDYPGWAAEIPDQTRADLFIAHLKACESGKQPWENLHILSLPNDHTSGTKAGLPTPAASIADNDLALGRIIEAISHSRYWAKTCIISIEDDPQAGWDHVSGFRTVCLVASPYTKRGAVISDHFNQPGIIRSIGLILGAKPLNQMDAGATPLRSCFTTKADLSPYQAAAARVPIDELNPKASAHRHPLMRHLAEQSAALPLDRLDACDEDSLNRILWHAMKGPNQPYPTWAIVPKTQRGDDDDDNDDEEEEGN